MPTCTCGKTVDDWRGARGHVQFTAGDGHGEKGDVPDGWRDLFEDDAETPADDDGDEDDGQEDATDAEVREAVDETEPDTEQSEASEGGRIKRLLTTPIGELLGGD